MEYMLTLVFLKEEILSLRLRFLAEGISPHIPIFLLGMDH